MDRPRQWYRTGDACRILDIHERTLRRDVEDGRLTASVHYRRQGFGSVAPLQWNIPALQAVMSHQVMTPLEIEAALADY